MPVIAKHSMFDGMFSVALKPDGAFRDELRAAGFDLGNATPEYPYDVWRSCLLIAARHVFPNEAQDRAFWLLGERFIDGYLDTMIGKLIAAALPFLSAKTLVQRSPRFCGTGVEGATFDLQWLGEKEAVLKMPELPYPNQFFTAGVVARCMELIKAKMDLDPGALGSGGSQLRMKW